MKRDIGNEPPGCGDTDHWLDCMFGFDVPKQSFVS